MGLDLRVRKLGLVDPSKAINPGINNCSLFLANQYGLQGYLMTRLFLPGRFSGSGPAVTEPASGVFTRFHYRETGENGNHTMGVERLTTAEVPAYQRDFTNIAYFERVNPRPPPSEEVEIGEQGSGDFDDLFDVNYLGLQDLALSTALTFLGEVSTENDQPSHHQGIEVAMLIGDSVHVSEREIPYGHAFFFTGGCVPGMQSGIFSRVERA